MFNECFQSLSSCLQQSDSEHNKIKQNITDNNWNTGEIMRTEQKQLEHKRKIWNTTKNTLRT